jgi:protein involved in polysaccharide export with SLBB domain
MAAENIAAVKPLFSEKIGARLLVVGEVEFPAKYKTEGCEISTKQLEELGLTLAQVDCGWIVTSGLVAKNAAYPIVQLNITNAGGTKSEAQAVKVQAYESITTANNKEVASESELPKKCTLTVALIGK